MASIISVERKQFVTSKGKKVDSIRLYLDKKASGKQAQWLSDMGFKLYGNERTIDGKKDWYYGVKFDARLYNALVKKVASKPQAKPTVDEAFAKYGYTLEELAAMAGIA